MVSECFLELNTLLVLGGSWCITNYCCSFWVILGGSRCFRDPNTVLVLDFIWFWVSRRIIVLVLSGARRFWMVLDVLDGCKSYNVETEVVLDGSWWFEKIYTLLDQEGS